MPKLFFDAGMFYIFKISKLLDSKIQCITIKRKPIVREQWALNVLENQYYLISNNSTSKINVSLGPIALPAPRSA